MKRHAFLSSFLMFFTSLSAQGLDASDISTVLSVLPWNGSPAALSLTFDDGDPSHLDVAIPLLDRCGWKATFFLIADKIERREEWRKAFKNGHELGNHSLNHPHAGELDAAREKAQVVGAHDVLAGFFGVPVRVFAYPFAEVSPGLRHWVSQTHLAGRGGGSGVPYMKSDDSPDWANLPSHTTKTADTPNIHREWLKETLAAKAWTILMIHGLEGTVSGWEPISKKTFKALLDTAAKDGFWVAPMGEVTAYWKAQKILETSVPSVEHGVTRWTWRKPADFPDGVVLKSRLTPPPPHGPKTFGLLADGKTLIPDSSGIFRIPFDAQSLELNPADHSH